MPRSRPTLPMFTALAGAALIVFATPAPASDAHGGHDAKPAKAAAEKPAEKAAEKPAAKGAEKPAEKHGEKLAEKAGEKAGEKAAPKAPEKAARGEDPMDSLREKLAARLGATKAPESKSPYVVRVVAKAEESHGAAPAPAPARARVEPALLAAAHRAAAPAAAERGHDVHWAYHGEGAPENWGQLKPEFAACSSGKRQSPIDIRGGVPVDLEPVKFDYRPSGFRVVDNGHTIQVNVGPGNSIEVMGRRYDLLQFHFHRPSEERIDGRQFDMVAHLVHKDIDGKLAVVAVLLDRGSAHPLVQTVWNNLPLEKGDEVAAAGALDLNHLLPPDRRYFTYMGSLTTPPCSEGVLWMVMKQPVPISPDQIGVFARLYPMNARPIQSAAGRLIKQSN